MQITGTVIKIFPTEIVGDNFQKREFVLRTDADQYPQEIQIQLTGVKTDLLNSVKEGDIITAAINIRGRSWTNSEGVVKWFNSLVAWSIMLPNVNYKERANQSAQEAHSEGLNKKDWLPTSEDRRKEAEQLDEAEDDLPF